jgi:multidrug resistance efflux pump
MADLPSRERIGFALRALAADLAAARRQVLMLRRENRELKAKLAALEAAGPEPGDSTPREPGRGGSAGRRSPGA